MQEYLEVELFKLEFCQYLYIPFSQEQFYENTPDQKPASNAWEQSRTWKLCNTRLKFAQMLRTI